MKRRAISLVMALCLCAALLPAPTFASTGGRSQSDAVAWANSMVGTAIDVDGAYGVQCVDLIKMYYTYLGENLGSIGYAYNMTACALPSGWVRYGNNTTPQPGDIVAFAANAYGAGDSGHVGIVTSVDSSNYHYVDYNGNNKNDAGTPRTKGLGQFSCVIRPDFGDNRSYVAVSDDVYVILSALDNSKAIDIAEGSTQRGANARLYTLSGSSAQSFQITSNGSGYRIIATCSGLSLDVMSGSRDNGANIWQYDANDTDSQRWRFVDAGDGYVYIESALGTYIDADNAGTSDGTNIQSYSFNGSNAQRWKIVKASSVRPVAPEKPTVNVERTDVTVSWNDVDRETSYNVYLVQAPWSWDDIKYRATVTANITTYTFTNVAPGEYKAFVISMPNGSEVQSGWTPLTVSSAKQVSSVILSTTSLALSTGSAETLTATVSPSDATDKTITWSSSNTGVAIVSNGKVTAVKAGSATITATAGGKTASCAVTVTDKDVAIQSIVLNNTSIALAVGESGTLTASVNPSNATNATLSWSSSNPSVATVSGGKVTAVKAGTATITATAGSKTASCTVTVTDKNVAVQSVTLNNTSIALAVGESGTLTASVNPSSATDKTVTWNSSNTSVVTVSGGKVTAIKAGSATITATAGGKTASCTVTVKDKAVAVESVTMSRADLSLKIGDQATLSATILPSNATSNTIAWSSNNANVATVSNGQVIATGSGTATITATAGEKSATCRVVVAEKEKSESPSDVHFEKATIYFQDQFSDVPANQWYTDSVASAFELGLMNGKGNKSFDPFGDVTIAEAITMAARIHSIYTTGGENFNQSEGSVWYQTYLDYAFKNSIISRAYYNCDATQKANRSQFAEIFAASLPAEALATMNEVNDGAIPDVDMSSDYANAVYRLYRAGILTGNDANGTFAPQTYITRAESAAIVSRMAESSNRKSITLR